METPVNYVPSDKFDIAAVQRLEALSDDELRSVIPDLLTWLQDSNWPVADPLADFLTKHRETVEPFLSPLLLAEQKDEIWTYEIINQLLKKWGNAVSDEIKKEISRIISSPTQGEVSEFVQDKAKELAEAFSK